MKQFLNQDVIDEKAAELFPEDGDVQSALASWFQGHLSSRELIDRLEYLKTFQFDRAAEAMAEDSDHYYGDSGVA